MMEGAKAVIVFFHAVVLKCRNLWLWLQEKQSLFISGCCFYVFIFFLSTAGMKSPSQAASLPPPPTVFQPLVCNFTQTQIFILLTAVTVKGFFFFFFFWLL